MSYNERELNSFFNIGKFNHPVEIGYVMNEIRKAKPVTINEWRFYYYDNVRSETQLHDIAVRMYNSIDECKRNNYSVKICLNYIKDVIFRRTFEGYNKENEALKVLNSLLNAEVLLSPKEWDGEYFIDFVIRKPLIGIQLKPATFYQGGYDRVVKIDNKLKEFESTYNAKTFVLVYEKNDNSLQITNTEVLSEILNLINNF